MPELPLHLPGPSAELSAGRLPLQGMTLLTVEDSRLACDALRLMCQRSGARLRRAESLAMGRAHLGCYRPDLVIVDLGLPDGDGCALIRDLHQRPGHPPILALSGDPARRGAALAAGADAFQDKPVPGLTAFQALVLRLVNGVIRPPLTASPGAEAAPLPKPDLMALRDDLAYAAAQLAGPQDAAHLRYVAGFLAGVAQSVRDDELVQAAQSVLHQPDGGPNGLAALITQRLAQPLACSLVPGRPPWP